MSANETTQQQTEPFGDLEALWWDRLRTDLGPDEAGWWLTLCPHPQHPADGLEPGQNNAEANFKANRFRCQFGCTGTYPTRSVALRQATAWLKGYASYSEMRKAEGGIVHVKSAAQQMADEFAAGHPDCPEEFLPNRHYIEFAKELVIALHPIPIRGLDGWWDGYCPIHDKSRKRGKPTAMYHFRLGSYRCLAEPPCHAPKKGMSIINLRSRVMTDAK